MRRAVGSVSSCDELFEFALGGIQKNGRRFRCKLKQSDPKDKKMIGKATANIIDVIAVVKSIRLVGGCSPMKTKRARRGRAFDRMPCGVVMTV